MSRFAFFLGVLPGALALCLVSGCGRKGPERYEVTGKVLFTNQPVDEGLIEVEPLDNQGTKSGASIRTGEYRIPRDKGLSPGGYRVSIYAGDGTSGTAPAGDTAPGPDAIPGGVT